MEERMGNLGVVDRRKQSQLRDSSPQHQNCLEGPEEGEAKSIHLQHATDRDPLTQFLRIYPPERDYCGMKGECQHIQCFSLQNELIIDIRYLNSQASGVFHSDTKILFLKIN